jgi:metal-dependent amidase/aminoacylase/carboxypeptidase family protein
MELSRELMGEDAFVLQETPDMGTEDFCYFGQKAPAVFFDLGVGSAPGHPVMPLHSARFTVDEEALYYGILMETALVLDYLKL